MKPTNTTSQRWSFDGYLNDGIQLDPLFVNSPKLRLRTNFNVKYTMLLLQFKFTLFRKMGNMEYRPFMIINVTADMCSVMNGVTNVFINLFAKQLKTYSNLYQPCPYRGHLYIKEHDLDIEDFPPIVPIGFYYSQFLFYTKYQKADRVVLRTKTHFEIIPKGIERF